MKFVLVRLPDRPAPALGMVDGSDAYSGAQMLTFGRQCADYQKALDERSAISLADVEAMEKFFRRQKCPRGSATYQHCADYLKELIDEHRPAGGEHYFQKGQIE